MSTDLTWFQKINRITIFCYALKGGMSRDDFTVFALAADGVGMCSHISSNLYFAQHDIGYTSDWKHKIYQEHYPDGYELKWLFEEELDAHKSFQKALEINKSNHNSTTLP